MEPPRLLAAKHPDNPPARKPPREKLPRIAYILPIVSGLSLLAGGALGLLVPDPAHEPPRCVAEVKCGSEPPTSGKARCTLSKQPGGRAFRLEPPLEEGCILLKITEYP